MKLKVHDYFIRKSMDLLRPGGILAVVTSKGTLDKNDSAVRKNLAEQADLLGAVRLPADSFGKSANTAVTSDLLFFRKSRAFDWGANLDLYRAYGRHGTGK